MAGKTLHQLLFEGGFAEEKYKECVSAYGLKAVWSALTSYLLEKGIENFSKTITDFNNIGRLYEFGLAVEDKEEKKKSGQYYTPRDVSSLMAELLIEGENITCIADVGCGCGNLILEVLEKIRLKSEDEFNALVDNIYLYDLDETAIRICISRISAKFGIDPDVIHAVKCDFLKREANLPPNCFVISNPPYAQIKSVNQRWQFKSAIDEAKDLYVGFIEKMVRFSKKAVIISPQSYIVGSNFKTLRALLFKYGNGEIYSFDNVPGTLFNEKKQGIFNTNTSNSVRASILVYHRSLEKGYRLTHLIRFKSTERKQILTVDYVKNQLGVTVQDLHRPLKCFTELEEFVQRIQSPETIESLLEPNASDQREEWCIHVNNSARYFVVGSVRRLEREGGFELYAKNERSFYLLYALLNSSYAYLWWRMLDGGILIPKSVLLSIPLPNDINFGIAEIDYCKSLIASEQHYLVYKKNAGKVQESIKFPTVKRDELNRMLFGDVPFKLIHSNKEIISDAEQPEDN